ncbi:MAG: hypothetical protein QM765_25275 [Myxococcales bacterium]
MAGRPAVVGIWFAALFVAVACGGNGSGADGGALAPEAGPKAIDAGAKDSGAFLDAAFVFGAVEVLASPARARDLVMDATHLYWVEPDERCTGPCRLRVKSMPKSGGAQATLASFPATEWSLAADLHDVYFSIADDAECTGPACKPNVSLYRLSKTGGPPTFVAYCGTGHFSSDGQAIYCAGWNGEVKTWEQQLLRIPIGGGSPAVLFSPVYHPGVTDWGLDVFWSTGETVMRIPKAGGIATALYENEFQCSDFLCNYGTWPHPVPSVLKLDHQFVYSVDPSQGLFEVPREGGTPRMLHGGSVTSLDAHSDHVYWTEDGCLGRIKSDGTDERCLEAGWLVRSVRVDDTFVYYVREYGDVDQIVRLPRSLEGQACTPKTCASECRSCGLLPDGCGGTLDCGPCRCLFDVRPVDLPKNYGAYGAGLNERGTILARVYFGPQCDWCWPEPLLVFPDGSFEKVAQYSPESDLGTCYPQWHDPQGEGVLGDDDEFVGYRYVWRHGQVSCLGPLDGASSAPPQDQNYWAFATSGGVIVGEAQSSGGYRAVAWRGASCSALGPDPLADQKAARATAIGPSGLIAGLAFSDSEGRVALWKPDGSSQALDLDGRPVAVNAAEEVLITDSRNPFGPSLVYRPDGTLRPLMLLARGQSIDPRDLNALGWVVGQTGFFSSWRTIAATLWMPGREPEDLNNLLTSPVPRRLVEASAVDDSGRILADDGYSGVYLLTPRPGCVPPSE